MQMSPRNVRFVSRSLSSVSAHHTRAKGLHRTSLSKSVQRVSYIFRYHLGRVPKGAMQGGRGVLTRKRGENSFSLDPFDLIFSALGF